MGEKREKISSIQLFALMEGFLIGSTIIINPASSAKEDSWLAFIIGWLGGLALISIYVMIAKKYPNKTLVEILKVHFGKYVGTFVAILYVCYFIHTASLVFRNFGEYNVALVYQDTPMVVIIALLAILIVYSVRGGIEVLARISELLQPLLILGILSLSLVLIASHNWTAMFPILKDGLLPVAKVGFSVMAFPFGELVAFMMIFPHLNKIKSISKVSYLGVAIGGAIILNTVLRDLIVLGPDIISEITYPTHLTSKLIPMVSIEPIVSLNFFICGGIKISVLIFAATYGISQIFKIDNYKPLVLAVTSFAVVLSIWIYSNVLEMFTWASKIYSYYALPFQVIIPIILLVFSFSPKKEQKSKQNS